MEHHPLLNELSPRTRHSLLILLQQQPQHQHQHQQQQQQLFPWNQNIIPQQQKLSFHLPVEVSHSPLVSYSPTDQLTIIQTPQGLSPNLTPNYHHSDNNLHQPFQPLNQQLEFFSPLTSPALRPLGYNHNSTSINPEDHPLTIPALIDQAATLGLSTPQSFIPQDLLSSNNSAVSQSINNNTPLQNNYLSTPSNFQSGSNFLLHPNPTTVPIQELVINPSHPSPPLLPHQSFNHRNLPNAKTSPRQTHLSGRPRPVPQSSRSRHSPLVRPADDSSNSTDHRNGSAKRARSLTRISVPTSPDFPSVLAKIGLADSPSPIDLYSRPEIHSSSSSSIHENPNTHAIAKPTSTPPPTIPLPQPLPTLPSDPNAWHIQPMTPASLLNFEKPLALASSAIGDSHDPHDHTDVLVCGKLDSVLETDEAFRDALVLDKPLLSEDFNTLHQDHGLNLKDQTEPSEQNGQSKNPEGKNTKDSRIMEGTKTKRGKTKEEAREKNGERRARTQGVVRIKVAEGTKETTEEEESIEPRKSLHKVAEQRRRDSLKMCFEDLRQLLPPIQWSEREEQSRRPGEGNVGGQRSNNAFDPSNPNKGISKVALLRRSNEYIVRLKERLKRRDGAIDKMVQILQQNCLLDESFSVNLTDLQPPIIDHPESLPKNQDILADLKALLLLITHENQEDNDDLNRLRSSSIVNNNHQNNTNGNGKTTSGSSLSEEID